MGQTKHGKVETVADKIRADLKRAGIPHKSVSVRMPHWGSVHVTIRDASISISTIKTIANAYECIRRDDASGEILSGGNTFVDVDYDGEVLKALVMAIGWRLANAKEGEIVTAGDRRVVWRFDGACGGFVSEIGDRYPGMHAHANVSRSRVLMWEDFRFPASQLAEDLLDRGIPLDVPSPPSEVGHGEVSDPATDGGSDAPTAPPSVDPGPDPTETDLVPVCAVAPDPDDPPGPVLSPSACIPLPPFPRPDAPNPYEAKQERRRERLERRAAKARGESARAFESARIVADGIPMGQPILVGHHSERRHRRDIARIDRGMRKGCDLAERAAYYESAAASVGSGGISSDDPEAIPKLQAELETLGQCREIEKHWNLEVRRAAKARAKETGKPCTQADHRAIVAGLVDCPAPIQKGLASYAFAFPWLPQFSGHTQTNIRRIEKRIAELTARATTPAREPMIGPGYKIEENKDANRVQIFFDTKPSAEIRAALKSRGFRWAPSEGAWQRHASNGAWYDAARALGRDPTP
jgi:hypothetical protein